MTREEFEKFKKKTIRNSTLTVLICAIGCIVPAIILKGMIDYIGKAGSKLPGVYLAFGIISVILIAVLIFAAVRVVTGACRKLREAKQNVNWEDEEDEEADEEANKETDEEANDETDIEDSEPAAESEGEDGEKQ